jgi:heterotetrameric sarcosine oxidase gamma subunit
VVELIEKWPLDDLLPIAAGAVSLTQARPGFIHTIMPHAGQSAALSKTLKAAHKLDLPGPGETRHNGELRILWFGRNQYLLVGDKAPDPMIGMHAAVTDHSDAWAVMHLTGELAASALARVCPLDIRAASFKPGNTARTEVAHLPSVITRLPDGFEIMVMQSLAKSAVHEFECAMHSVAAQSQMYRNQV